MLESLSLPPFAVLVFIAMLGCCKASLETSFNDAEQPVTPTIKSESNLHQVDGKPLTSTFGSWQAERHIEG